MLKKYIKLAIIILCCLVIVLALYSCYEKTLLRIFKKKESLNYHNINSIEVIPRNVRDVGVIQIENKEDIEKILNYLNSLELIKEKKPNYKINSRDGLSQVGYFTIHFYGYNSDGITFTTEYLTIYHGGHDWDYTSYYIVDSGYNPNNNSSKFSDFLDELISKYVEE